MLKEKMKKAGKNVYELPKQGKMLVPGKIFASEKIFENVEETCVQQLSNVAQLPGIIQHSLAMPDVHSGYGFPIGGVAAFDLKKGVISPGGVGYDINCGVRVLVSDITKEEFLKKRKEILEELFIHIPSGVGKKSRFNLNDKELNEVLEKGVSWAIKNGYGTKKDLERTEDNGCIASADASKVSQKARGRGRSQLGTLGAGNHFIDIQEVDEVYDNKIAKVFGFTGKGQICIMIHTGSRGLGHQTASDYIRLMEKEYGFKNLPDRELVCAPIDSKLGKEYRAAMACAANFAFTNRHLIMCQIRKVFEKYFPKKKLELVYDVAHNIAKFEDFIVNGKKKTLCVHRKGATRSFGKGRKEIPVVYRKVGQPVFIPGSMGTNSYVLVGTKKAEEISFASTAHGAGRALSRTSAKQNITSKKLTQELEEKNILLKVGRGIERAIDESPAAYKNVDEVVRVSDELGIGKKVVKLKPLGVLIG